MSTLKFHNLFFPKIIAFIIVFYYLFFIGVLGLPWIHGALPHSPLHALALADKKETVENGHVKEEIDFVRETRVSGVLAHILIGVSLLASDNVMKDIPKPVLDGLFLFLGLSGKVLI